MDRYFVITTILYRLEIEKQALTQDIPEEKRRKASIFCALLNDTYHLAGWMGGSMAGVWIGVWFGLAFWFGRFGMVG